MQISHNTSLENITTNEHRYAVVDDNGRLLTSNSLATGGQIDAFGRLRVSQISTQLDIKQIHDAAPLFYDTELIGTGLATYDNTNACSDLSTSANADAVIKQTFQRSNYQSGKSHQMFMTFGDFHTQTNITKRVGYFTSNTTTPFDSDKDGFFLENANGTVTFQTHKTGTQTNSLARANWDDSMDGTGASGIDLDFTKTQIVMFEFEWLGVGICQMSFVVDGQIHVAHTFKNANNLSDVYMSSPNSCLRYEIRQTGAGSGTFKQICSTVGSEGSLNEIGKILSDNLGSSIVNANAVANTYALLGIRLSTTDADASIDLLDINAIALTNDSFLWKIILNPTVDGTFNYSGITNSVCEIAKGDTSGNPSTNTVTNGTLLASGYIVASGGASSGQLNTTISNAIRLGMSIAGVSDEIVLAVQPLAVNLDITGSISWRERT
jgi:hypothetical protein